MSLRAEIIATAREMLRLGLVAGTSGNVSGRAGEGIEITPSALPYERMTETDLVSLAADGSVVEGHREPSSEHRVHVAVYAARPDARAIVHTHSVHATAWSLLGEPLDTGTEELEHQAGGAVRTAGFAPTGSDEIAELCVAALEDRRAALLGGHGVVALGATPAAALVTCQSVERQARISWLLRGSGRA
jgi:L-fuculose-phosphate aldolase